MEAAVSDIPSQIWGESDISFYYYVPFAVLGLWAIRKYQLTFQDVYFMGGAASVLEMGFFGAATLLISPFFFITPVVIVNYFFVYGILLALPLLFVNETLLWNNTDIAERRQISMARKLGIGVLISGVSWLIAGMIGTSVQYLL